MADRTAPAREPADCAPESRSPDFASELRSRLAQGGPHALLAGNITLIGLDTIKARLGARWHRLSERAHQITRNTIARHLGPGDIYTAWQDTNYVIVFGNVPQKQALVKCRVIALEIGKALLGEDGCECLEVKSAVATLDGGIALAEMPSIAELLQTSAKTPDANAPDEIVAADLATMPLGEDSAGLAAAAPEPQFAFSPMWDRTLGALSTYRCTLSVPPHLPAEMSAKEAIVRSDLLLQKRVLEEFGSMMFDGRKFLLFLPVQFETLAANASRRRFVEALAASTGGVAARLLVIEIVGVPSGIPHSSLIEIVAPLRRHCRSAVAHVAVDLNDIGAFRGTGIHAIGCDLAASGASDLVLMQLISRFQRIAERAELATYIRGLRSRSLAAAALGAGFRYLEGEAIAKPVLTPQALREFRLLDIYMPLIGA